MADLFDLVAKLTLDSSEYSSGLDAALGKVKSVGGTIAKVGTAAVGAATAGIVAFGKSAVDAGMNFDSSMSQVAATMGTTVDEISELRDFAQEMGSTTAFSATQAADALNYMALAGYDAETSMQMLPNVLNLAAAGGIELASASDMVTDAQSALGLSLDETSELVDKMAKASSKSNTSVAQLGDAILTVGGTAKNLAGGTTELSTALGILADNGIKGAEGGTALRNIILSLSAPTDTAAKKMQSLGLSAYDAEGNLRPLEDIFGDLNETLSTMTQGEQTEVLNTLFNKVDLKSANALLATSKTRWKDLSKEINNASGAAQQMADTQLDNLAGDITLFKSALEGAQIAISDSLSPTLRGFVQDASEGVSRLTEAFKSGGLTAAMEETGDVLSGMLTRVVETTPNVVEGALSLLRNLGKGIIDNADTIIYSAENVIDTLISYLSSNSYDFGDAAGRIITKLATALGNNSGKIVSGAANIISNLATGLLSEQNVSGYVTAAGNIASGIIGSLPNVVTTLWSGGETILDGIVQGATKGAATAAGQIVGSLIKAIKDVFANKNMMEVLSDMMLFITNPGAALFTKIQKALSDPSVMGNFMVGLYKGMNPDKTDITNDNSGGRKRVTDATTAGTEATEKNTEAVVKNADAFTKANHALTDADKNFGSYTSSATKSVAANNGLNASLSSTGAAVSGAGGKFGELSGAVQTTTTQLSAATSSIQQSVENLQTMGDAAGNAVTGFETIAQGLQNLQTAINNVPQSFGAMWSFVKGIFANAPAFFGNVGSQSAQQFVAPWNDVPGKMQNVWNNIKSVFNKTGEAYVWGYDLSKNYAEGISKGADLAVQAAQTLAQRIKDNLGFSEPKEGPLSDFHTYAPDMMELFADGVNENQRVVMDSVRNAFDFRDAITAPETMTYSSTADGNAQQSAVDAKLDAIADKLDALADAILNQTIEMDGEKVADLIDARLGTNTLMKARV